MERLFSQGLDIVVDDRAGLLFPAMVLALGSVAMFSFLSIRTVAAKRTKRLHRPLPNHEPRLELPPPVPPLVLSDALLFAAAKVSTDVLRSLEGEVNIWNEALVLTPQFWDPGPDTILLDQVLNNVIDLSKDIPALAAASIRFDPDRGIQIANVDAAKVSATNRELLAVARHVQLDFWQSLAQLVEMTPELAWATVADCSKLKQLSLPAAARSLKSLRTLSLISCESLTDISALAALTSLEILDLTVCSSLVNITPLASLTLLRELFISYCEKLTDISPLGSLSSLRSLTLLSCPALKHVTHLGSLTQLRKLHLNQCEGLVNISAVEFLTSLQVLNLNGCGMVSRNISAFRHLSSLETLDLSGCCELTDLAPLKSLAALNVLHLSDIPKLKSLPDMSLLTNVKKLNLGGCDQLSDISSLRSLTALEDLTLEGGSLSDMTAFASLKSLKRLVLEGCGVEQVDLHPLGSLSALTTLSLYHCEKLENLSMLGSLHSLESLRAWNCPALTDVSALSSLKALQKATFRGCKKLVDVEPLAAIPHWSVS